MDDLYAYVSMVEDRLNKNKSSLGSPYTDLACDIKWDLSKNRSLYSSEAEFLEHVKSRMRGRDMEEAYRTFLRNYRAWLRNRR